MPSQTDVTPKAISGTGLDGLEISGRSNAKNTFDANNFGLQTSRRGDILSLVLFETEVCENIVL